MLLRIQQLKKPASVLAVFATFWLTGYVFFISTITNQKPRFVDVPTDAIVVLTGGTGRINEGLNLISSGLGNKLFISGVGENVSLSELFRLWEGNGDSLQCCITLDHRARNTRDNAVETSKWMQENGFRSLRLVTSAYHMPRAWLEFHYEMPYTKIILHPVNNSKTRIGDDLFMIGLQEYNKTLLTYMRNFFGLSEQT
jgi:uncharacterized SAM-binding protein YcdF (DUF218 family)